MVPARVDPERSFALLDFIAVAHQTALGISTLVEDYDLCRLGLEYDLDQARAKHLDVSLDLLSPLNAQIRLPSPFEIIEVPIREFINWEKTRDALTNIGDLPAKKVMTHRVIMATEEMSVEAAAALMLNEGISRLPVIKGKKITGILTRADIINAIGASYSDKDEAGA